MRWLLLLIVVLLALAWARPIDHDESQYVAAAVLSARGLLPFRDYAYLQTPLQPLLFAPLAWVAGGFVFPALRLLNALLGVAAVAGTWTAMRRAGVGERTALAAAALMAGCDILLFAAGTARNDALPAAMLAWALVPIVVAERGRGSRSGALLTGLLLAGATAAKLSYAAPAAAYGVYALWQHPQHRPGWVAAGALPAVLLVLWTVWLAPVGALYGMIGFPTAAPAEYYAATGQEWRLSGWRKALDLLKFLALGAALPALVAVARRRSRLLTWLLVAGMLAAAVPTPVWRQYLLPLLPPLFVALAIRWQQAPPTRGWRIAFAVFAAAGLAPSIASVLNGGGLSSAVAETRALADAGLSGEVATLSPQLLPGGSWVDPRFAAGPFYFRSQALLPPVQEPALHLVAAPRMDAAFAARAPAAVLVGGEGRWTSGNDRLDAVLERWAITHGYTRVPVASTRLRLYAAARLRASSRPE